MERYSSRLVSFNPRSKVIKELGITGRSESFLAIPYAESPVLVDGPSETKFDEPANKKRKKGPPEAIQVEQAGTSKEAAMQPQDEVVVTRNIEQYPQIQIQDKSTVVVKNARSINAQVNEVGIPVDIGQELTALKSAVRSLRDDISAAIKSLRSEIRTSFQSLRSEHLSKQA